MKFPPYIKKGDTISLIAPSFGCTTEPYKTELKVAISNLKKLGFKIEEGKNIRRNDGVLASAGPKARAEEFLKAYEGPSKAIISVGGGETMVDILPYVDFSKLATLPPKWFMGFSDNTNLTFTLSTLSNVPSIYGPCAPAFARPLELESKDAIDLLTGSKRKIKGYPTYQIEGDDDPTHKVRELKLNYKKVITPLNYKGPFEGTLIGGCLDCLLGLVGTKWDKVNEFIDNHKEGLIWYLEACDLNPVSIRRGLFHLLHAGWFRNAKGFIIGRPLCINDDYMGLKPHQAVTDILEKLHVPVLLDVDLGHYPPSMPLINLSYAKIAMVRKNIEIEFLLPR